MAILDDSLLCLSKFSTAGLQQLAGIQGDTKAKAIFWVSVFIGALALLGLQVNSLVAYVDSYPTRVNIEVNRRFDDSFIHKQHEYMSCSTKNSVTQQYRNKQ